MNKSEAYRMAIKSVMVNTSIRLDERVDILRFLFSGYDTAKWSEEHEAKEDQA